MGEGAVGGGSGDVWDDGGLDVEFVAPDCAVDGEAVGEGGLVVGAADADDVGGWDCAGEDPGVCGADGTGAEDADFGFRHVGGVVSGVEVSTWRGGLPTSAQEDRLCAHAPTRCDW